MAAFIPVDPFDIVIIGGNGDLARRKLLPALFHRFLDGQIHKSCRILAIARSDMTLAGFKDFAMKACKSTTKVWDKDKWKDFSKHLDYMAMDATDPKADWGSVKAALPDTGRPLVLYLAITPLILSLIHI